MEEIPKKNSKKNRTVAGRTLYFPDGLTITESLQKIANHGFKIGYTYTINIDGESLTRIVAYNDKKDILYCWASQDKLPDRRQCLNKLYIIRQRQEGEATIVRRFEENYNNCVRGRIDSSNKVPKNFEPISIIDSLNYFTCGWPIIEGPKSEQIKRQIKKNYKGTELEKKLEALSLYNLYYFDRVYEQFDDGLKNIYAYLNDHKLELFYERIIQKLQSGDQSNIDVVIEITQLLNISIDELKNKLTEFFGKVVTPTKIPIIKHFKHHIYTLFPNKKRKWI